MRQTIGTMDLRKRLGELLDRVALRHDQFIVERQGRPLAALVPVEKLEQLDQLARTVLKEALARSRTDLPEEQAAALADEAKHKGR